MYIIGFVNAGYMHIGAVLLGRQVREQILPVGRYLEVHIMLLPGILRRNGIYPPVRTIGGINPIDSRIQRNRGKVIAVRIVTQRH